MFHLAVVFMPVLLGLGIAIIATLLFAFAMASALLFGAIIVAIGMG